MLDQASHFQIGPNTVDNKYNELIGFDPRLTPLLDTIIAGWEAGRLSDAEAYGRLVLEGGCQLLCAELRELAEV